VKEIPDLAYIEARDLTDILKPIHSQTGGSGNWKTKGSRETESNSGRPKLNQIKFA